MTPADAPESRPHNHAAMDGEQEPGVCPGCDDYRSSLRVTPADVPEQCGAVILIWDGEGEYICTLPAGHEGRHRDGHATWEDDVESFRFDGESDGEP